MPPAAATTGDHPVRLLDVGLDVRYEPAFAPAAEASAWLDTLVTSIRWRQETVTVFGRRYPAPRLTAWYGEPGVRYHYAGIEHVAQGWTPTLETIRERVQRAVGSRFNAVLLNRYRDGRDSVGWHSDDEPSLGSEPVIASVSLGGSRRLRLRWRGKASATEDGRDGPMQRTHELLLAHGSLMVMRGGTQAKWQHCVPRCARAAPRLNLTFRLVGKAG